MLLQILRPARILAMLLVGFGTFSSFSIKTGGDSFEVYLNKKLLIQQFVSKGEAAKSIALNAANANDELEIYYSHCGQTGTDRSISLRDAQNRILKQWRFQDSPGVRTSMNCGIKDLLNVQKNTESSTLQLVYASHELPEGRVLAVIAK